MKKIKSKVAGLSSEEIEVLDSMMMEELEDFFEDSMEELMEIIEAGKKEASENEVCTKIISH